jgi:hypothetical protein
VYVIVLVTLLTGVKEASHELEDGVGIPIVAVHLLEVLLSRRFGEEHLVLLVVLRMLNKHVPCKHQVFHPLDGNS